MYSLRKSFYPPRSFAKIVAAATLPFLAASYSPTEAQSPSIQQDATPSFSTPRILGENAGCYFSQTNTVSPIVSAIVVDKKVETLGTALVPGDVVVDFRTVAAIVPAGSKTAVIPPNQEEGSILKAIQYLDIIKDLPELAPSLRARCLNAMGKTL